MRPTANLSRTNLSGGVWKTAPHNGPQAYGGQVPPDQSSPAGGYSRCNDPLRAARSFPPRDADEQVFLDG